ncbi:hypothetical protein THC_0766 [Caldimicrobium thiodismutans]|uniref:Methyltransferase type 11 domain-containing protein n=1 Tax=Caldimicrobium thiodismutans TaxID=1653476 RepID=A0A0U5BWW5_9BACT|nr:class I SAM-dependent methyltransferase [Caldimicrobium thiodismutans]BAU23157.1 hypothetical protein THC_0766 [Caldimicrobium thiodismutans]
MNFRNEKAKVLALLEVQFESPLARHQDIYFCDINVWREADLLPSPFKELVKDGEPGAKATLEVSGKDFFNYKDACVYDVKKYQFKPPRKLVDPKLRLGRFYPLGFFRELPGIYEGNPYPGRIIFVDDAREEFKLDANHPLGIFENLKFIMTILEVQPKSSELGGRCRDYWELAFRIGPGMQARYDRIVTDFGLDEKESFTRFDETPDTEFYREPRFLPHIDRCSHNNLINFYSTHLKGKKILDLMSSFESHLSEGDFEVIGLGLNKEELKANPKLKDFVIKDINADPLLPFQNEEFDAVVCDLSIEYLIHPIQVLKEINRILKPKGQIFFSFSNRYFPPKVIKLWIDLQDFERMGYVLELFNQVQGFTNLRTYSLRGFPRPKEDKWAYLTSLSDPLYIVWAEKGG